MCIKESLSAFSRKHDTSLKALSQVVRRNYNPISIPHNRTHHSDSESKIIVTRNQHPAVPEIDREEEPHDLLHQRVVEGGTGWCRVQGMPVRIGGRGEGEKAAMPSHVSQGLFGQVVATVLGHVSSLSETSGAGRSCVQAPSASESNRGRF